MRFSNIIGLLFLGLATMAGHVGPVAAQVAVSAEEQLALAIICANEGDLTVHRRGDCAAIYESLVNFARQRTVSARRACLQLDDEDETAERAQLLADHGVSTCENIEITWLEHARGVEVYDPTQADRTRTIVSGHSDRAFDRTRTDARRYIPFLRADGVEPLGWPTQAMRHETCADGHWPRTEDACTDGEERVRVIRHVGWESRREDWLATYALARRILTGEVESSCEEPPLTWGCPGEGRRDCGDHARAMEHGLVRVECAGSFANWFYTRDTSTPATPAESADIDVVEVALGG